MANRDPFAPIMKKFKLSPKFPHKRSEGMTKRTNSGAPLQKKRK